MQQRKGLPALVKEVWELVVAYARQETIEPAKRLGRYLALGLAGAFLGGIGITLLVLGGLRALQTETSDTFSGDWSWVPYLMALTICLLVAAVAMGARSRGKKGKRS